MLWVKSFHIVFVASWFAGLFYLPRIFVNLAMVPAGSVAERERLLLMAAKLYSPLGWLRSQAFSRSQGEQGLLNGRLPPLCPPMGALVSL